MNLLVNGRDAYAYTGGRAFDPALPCVVFVHGALHDHSVWTLLARWCAHHGYGVLAIDQPGHGRSAGPVLPSVEALADWTLALLDAAGVQRSALVGHSMGALIALQAAAHAPQRITRLVMLGAAYPMKVSEVLLKTAAETPLQAIDMVNALSISTHGAKPSYPGPGMWLHGANRALMRRILAGNTDVNLFQHDFSLCDGYAGGEAAMAKVSCPVTLVTGDRDQMTPPKATRELARTLKAKVLSVPSGHSLMAEAPDAVLQALRGALA
jgi:pimeloyl-ACP methyl ester carboxylesterase